MARTNSIAQNKVDPTRPFFAAIGSVDAAVGYARSGLSGAQNRFEQAQSRLAKVDLEPRALADGLQREALALPGRVEALVTDTVEQYVDLAARGRTLVNRIRRQQATQDLETEAKSTVTRARTTRTQTKKAASTAKSSAKATGTSARKTATAARKATKASASKVGTAKA